MVGIVGYMSGGKSYTAVELLLRYMIRQHRIVTNIKLNCRAVTDYVDMPCVIWKQYYYFLADNPESIPHNGIGISDYENWPSGSPRGSASYERDKVYIFLDEVSSLFDSMTSSSDGGIKAVATWARHSEKRGQILYLIMQFPSELHKRLRSHITEYIECTNTNSVKIPLFGVGLPFFLRNMIIRRQLMPDLETVLGSAHWSQLDPKVFHCYNTGQIVVGSMHDAFKPVSVVADYSEQRQGEVYERLMVVFVFVWLLSVCFAFWRFSHGS